MNKKTGILATTALFAAGVMGATAHPAAASTGCGVSLDVHNKTSADITVDWADSDSRAKVVVAGLWKKLDTGTTVSDVALVELLRGCEADIGFGGHTHDATDRRVGGVRAVDPGSVSNPLREDRCATYSIVDVEPNAHRIEHRIVDYDHVSVLDKIDRVRIPPATTSSTFTGRADNAGPSADPPIRCRRRTRR